MRHRGARILPVSSGQALGGIRLLGGPLRLVGWSFNDGNASSGSTVDQSASAPAAGGTVASISLPNGLYTISWSFELSGTVSASDVDNVQLLQGATVIATSVNPGAAGNYPQEEAQVFVTFGPATISWKAIGAATVGSTYKIEANITPSGASTGNIQDGSLQVGFIGMPQQGVDTQWLDEEGVEIETDISVHTTLGLLQGVIYYYLQDDLDHHYAEDTKPGA